MENVGSSNPQTELTVPSLGDVIEYCRGQIAALSFVNESTARDVHILSIRRCFERAGLTSGLRYSLAVLDLMREVQDLGQGYWFPTPLRHAPLGDTALVIGAIPTRELRRHIVGIRRAGYARVASLAEVSGLPYQPLEAWTSGVNNSVSWVERELRSAHSVIGPTLTSAGVEMLGVSKRVIGKRPVSTPCWRAAASGGFLEWAGLVLCRERLPGHYRYFLGQLDKTRVIGEAPVSDVNRVMFGFARLAGSPVMAIATHSGNAFALHLCGELPKAERRLCLALGNRQGAAIGKVYSFSDTDFESCITSAIQNLGVDMKVSNA